MIRQTEEPEKESDRKREGEEKKNGERKRETERGIQRKNDIFKEIKRKKKESINQSYIDNVYWIFKKSFAQSS